MGKIEKQETQKEIESMEKSGMIRVNLQSFERRLKNQFGLKLDLNTNNNLLKYYNTSNQQHYLCATTTALDETGKCFSNIYGKFYQDHVTLNSRLYQQFKSFRSTYFTVLSSGHILTI